ncbi:MAG TPA: GTP 3',8-cyclase MoaA [Gemmatimonadales bacterium]|nr:GTP 3',8-cyclase MoaA [Gemmatimonadales bacterium]
MSHPPSLPATSSSLAPLADKHGRPLGSLRLSVTDRCNMRCGYCMPEESYVWLPRESLLTLEELDRLAGIFVELGAGKLRLTGGEPLLRHGLPTLVRLLAARPGVRDLALTTNGILLGPNALELRQAGLHRLTVSLDTLRAERMLAFARSTRHGDVLAGIAAAQAAGFERIKLNSVVIRGFNDDEVPELLEYARAHRLELRYIEYMDVGGATRWRLDDVVSRAELLASIERRYGPVEPLPDPASPRAPAERFRLRDGTVFGVIASVTAPFCARCDRSRVTADGTWFSCLYAERGMDLREPLRMGRSDPEIAELVSAAWRRRDDRGAEERLGAPGRTQLYQVEGLRADPHREMHTRGG